MNTIRKISKGLMAAIITLVLANPLFSQTEGTVKSSEVKIEKAFSAIEVTGVYKVIINQGDEQLVRFESKQELEGNVWAEVNGNTLSFGCKNINPKKVTIYVTFRNLEKVYVSGA
ncbi:MAG: DUF2807 domain-containing protein, partial [Bacteroidetes bacterium]|nr:DUF2807 domain-containing protein [Bacteroidota bacterium]